MWFLVGLDCLRLCYQEFVNRRSSVQSGSPAPYFSRTSVALPGPTWQGVPVSITVPLETGSDFPARTRSSRAAGAFPNPATPSTAAFKCDGLRCAYRLTRAVVEWRNSAAMVPSLWPVIASRLAKVWRRSCQVAHSISTAVTAGPQTRL